jgi:hypothetical protein
MRLQCTIPVIYVTNHVYSEKQDALFYSYFKHDKLYKVYSFISHGVDNRLT